MFKWINTTRINEAYHDIIDCLVAALEARDPYTEGHSMRVADMALELARSVGLTGTELEEIHIAAHLHDIGKIGISDQVLQKPGRLLPHEFAAIQQHPVIGYQVLTQSQRLKSIATIVQHHHERWDGRGYPAGLKAGAIPLGSRIIAICDAVDAMTTARPYRHALSWQVCWHEVAANKGLQFDAELVHEAAKIWSVWEERYVLEEAAV